MVLLEKNWENIKKKVIIPLWNSKFKTMYERIKLDYNDFESLAGVEMSKAMSNFDLEKSNLFTYATNIINKKAMTELRNCTQRDVRKALYISDSVDALDKSIIENIPCNNIEDYIESIDLPEEIYSEKMIKYLNRLSKLQQKILFALSEGYTNEEIIIKFKLTATEMADAYKAIKSYRNVSVLY